MNIAIDCREILKNQYTGIERYLKNIFYHLETRKSNLKHSYLLYGNQYTDFDSVPDFFSTREIKEISTLIWDNINFPIQLNRDDIDLLFSPYDKAPLFSKTPYIITIHDLLFLKHTSSSGIKKYFYNKFYKLYHRQIAKNATKIITVSDHSKKDIRDIYNIAGPKIEVIPNCISKRFHPISQSKVNSFRDNNNLENDYILYVGNFKPHKNVSNLVRAYANLPKKIRENNKLVLCGHKSNDLASIKRIIDSLNLKEKIELLHNISDDQLPKLYSGANLFVFPSLYEGFGLPPLEAMACGTPVICSNRTSLPEVVGKAAILMNPDSPEIIANKIKKFFSNNSLANELRSKGLKRAKLFRPEKVLPHLIQIINQAGATQ